MKIKFCGLYQDAHIAYANEIKPDYVGFVFWNKSRRYVTADKARELRNQLDSDIQVVGVFVDEDIDRIIDLYQSGIIDVAQLHGAEDDIYIKRLQGIGIPVIKAYVVSNNSDIIVQAQNSIADYVLFDAGKGDGKTFDWDLLRDFNRDYFLAGGLNLSNIREVTQNIKPFAVDVSSGIETNGEKDKSKMEQFARVIRDVEN
ncbi:MAG: phosphoribosylanthranilate isomerase [Lachnospiraceae bacterium]|nr:phosphoribosylanthranilate isomerase [Lachnospiraceae bacterium]